MGKSISLVETFLIVFEEFAITMSATDTIDTEICGKVRRIGTIHTPFKDIRDVPRQSSVVRETCRIEVFKEYEAGLKDIETFSHIIVLYWLHKASGFSLLTKTPWDEQLHGVFATRSPYRPNPIGISVVKLIERRGNMLYVSGIDAIDGTPLIDLKPYVPQFDEKPDANAGWLSGKLNENERKSCKARECENEVELNGN